MPCISQCSINAVKKNTGYATSHVVAGLSCHGTALSCLEAVDHEAGPAVPEAIVTSKRWLLRSVAQGIRIHDELEADWLTGWFAMSPAWRFGGTSTVAAQRSALDRIESPHPALHILGLGLNPES